MSIERGLVVQHEVSCWAAEVTIPIERKKNLHNFKEYLLVFVSFFSRRLTLLFFRHWKNYHHEISTVILGKRVFKVFRHNFSLPLKGT